MKLAGTLIVPTPAAAPGSPVVGQLYFDASVSQLFYYNGTTWIAASGGSMAPTQTVLSGSGTYTVPAGCKAIRVECIGGGGAGSGLPALSAGQGGAGGGGGGGGYAASMIQNPSASYAYVVGAGGTGSSGGGGATGSDTTFGATVVVAKGGVGGILPTTFAPPLASQIGGAGGGAGGGLVGTITMVGEGGGSGLAFSGTLANSGGAGGSAPRGGGGALAMRSTGSGGTAGAFPGGGGGGASCAGAVVATAGGSGAAGTIIVTEYYGPASLGSGTEIGYDQITSDFALTATTQATAQLVIPGTSRTYDGLPVVAEFFSPSLFMPAVASNSLIVDLTDEQGGTTQLGVIAQATASAAVQGSVPGYGRHRFTPTAGAHTYAIRAWVTSTTGAPAIGAGAAGAGVRVPASLRITKV